MLLKILHVTCAYLTGLSFLARGLLALNQHPILKHRLVRVLPHLVDTMLLISAVGLLISWGVSPFQMPWLMTKLAALAAFIGFGFLMLRFGHTAKRRWTGFVLGVMSYGYIVAVAHSKSPLLG